MKADWQADSGQKRVVPLRLVIGQVTRFGAQSVNLQASAGHHVERPDDGVRWLARLQMQVLFPK